MQTWGMPAVPITQNEASDNSSNQEQQMREMDGKKKMQTLNPHS